MECILMTDFVSNVSHELKTPITSMKVLADSLVSNEDADLPMYKEFIGLGAIGATYDIKWAGKVYDGTGLGLGLTFGYVMPIKSRINIDFHAGFGFIFYKHKEYFNGDQYDADYIFDGEQRANASGYYLLPTRIGVSISYILK